MVSARVHMPNELNGLLRSELEQAIEQANLGTVGTYIAQKYLIEQVPQIEIAEELGYDRTVITRRIKQILPRVEWAAKRLFGNSHTTAS